MAVKKKQDKKEGSANYASSYSELKTSGPESLYLIWGEEDYLSRQFANAILDRCIPSGSSDFGYACFDGAEFNVKAFLDFAETPPFMTERSYCELRNVDFGQLEDYEKDKISELFSDPPEYCSIVVLYYAQSSPDSRSKVIKNLRENGKELVFNEQDSSSLVKWITKRFASYGKEISPQTALYLMERSGRSMRTLINEIAKTAAYSEGKTIAAGDINTVTDKIDEGEVFVLADQITAGNFNLAFDNFSRISSLPSFEAIPFIALLASQFRRLYCAKTTGDYQKVMQYTGAKEFAAKKAVSSSRRLSAEYLSKTIVLCADADFAIKSSVNDEKTVLKNLILDLCNA